MSRSEILKILYLGHESVAKSQDPATCDKMDHGRYQALVESHEKNTVHRTQSCCERWYITMQTMWKSILFLFIVTLVNVLSFLLIPAVRNQLNFTWESVVVIEITMVALIAMMADMAPDLVMVIVSVILMMMQIITVDDAIKGLSSSSILAIGVLFVVSKGLDEAGIVEKALMSVLGHPKRAWVAIIRLTIPVALASAFFNNTPLVAMMIPVIENWCQRTGIPSSKLYMPLSFASMLGGMCTVLGTSTNLVLKDLAAKSDPPYEITMFTMSSVGFPLMAIGITTMVLFSFLLPNNTAASSPFLCVKHYVGTYICQDAADGTPLSQTGLQYTHTPATQIHSTLRTTHGHSKGPCVHMQTEQCILNTQN